MKLFQQLLVAPAALGLIAPIAATATELDINGVSGYSDSIEDVQSISQFSDVYPTDWAYQALTSLAERHGCVAANPSGSITRYEAAALLNQCLGDVAQVNEEERRLLNEFGPELAVIKGRLDGLEARVGEFEAGQFSTTTKMTGKVAMVLGAVDRDAANDDATTFHYVKQLNLNTSFTGKDLLYTRIKSGNFAGPFVTNTYGTYLKEGKGTSNDLKVDKIWYEFPVGDNFKVWMGPEIENYYMLASAPSIYKPMLKQFALGGNGGTYGASTAQGFGAAWIQSVDDRSQPRFAVSSNYVAKNGDTANPESGGGMLSDNVSNWLTKVEYGAPRWQVSFAVAQKYCDKPSATNNTINTYTETCFDGGSYYGTKEGIDRTGNSTNYGVRGYWRPEEAGLVPSVQVGYDWSSIDDDGVSTSTEATAAWMMGFMWDDAFVDGNMVGIAIGKRQYATDVVDGTDDPADDNFVWEAYYDIKVSDSITVTPAIFGGKSTYEYHSDDVFGGLVQTTFKF